MTRGPPGARGRPFLPVVPATPGNRNAVEQSLLIFGSLLAFGSIAREDDDFVTTLEEER
jgi:hypothetical protein